MANDEKSDALDRVLDYATLSGYVNIVSDVRHARIELADLRRKAAALDAMVEHSMNVVVGRGCWFAGPSSFVCDWRHDTPLDAIETAVEWLEKKEQADGE